LDGVQEVMKNLWLIIDNPKIEVKEKMKAMNLIMQYQIMRLKKVDSEAFNKEFLDYIKKVQNHEEALRIREQGISRREKSLEKALEDHLKNQKLTQEEFWQIRDPNAVF
jgi:elongation factor P hydroxylase